MDDQEESGWKYIHGDVFRFPVYKSLFAAALGVGTQLFTLWVSLSNKYLSFKGVSCLCLLLFSSFVTMYLWSCFQCNIHLYACSSWCFLSIQQGSSVHCTGYCICANIRHCRLLRSFLLLYDWREKLGTFSLLRQHIPPVHSKTCSSLLSSVITFMHFIACE